MSRAYKVKIIALAGLGFWGCVADVNGPPEGHAGSGGTLPAAGGSSSPAGGASSLAGFNAGGVSNVAGTAGAFAGVGGVPPAAGGSVSAGMGGALSAGNGGTDSAGSGGDTSNGGSGVSGTGGSDEGGTSGGGMGGTGGAGDGGTSSGGAAGTAGAGGNGGSPTCSPNCGSHKWACWPMPNPTGSGLPNPASYTDLGNGVVHDNVTCLDWEKSPPSTTRTNQDALSYCSGLSLGGHDDWRLPTRVELASILDWTRSPAVDAALTAASGFHKTGSNWVLTIDQIGAGAGHDYAWAYNMSDGIVSNARSAATPDRARCVRGNGAGEDFSAKAVEPPNLYTALSSDEARDNYTGLIWQRDGNASGLLGWDAAVTYCNNLTLGGHDNWRLPSIRELATLVDEADVAPSIDEAMFPNTHYGSRSNNWYWASHRARNSTTASWGLNFDDGFTGFNSGAAGAWNYWTSAYAKCVR